MNQEDRAEQGAEADDAAQAFEGLRAEVSALRRTINSLPAAIEGGRAPDYSPTLAGLVQGLGRLEAGLAVIAGHPALALSPQQHARALGEGAAEILRTAAAAVRAETTALGTERKAFAGLVGRAATRERQRRVRLGFGLAGVVFGIVLYPLAGTVLPGGSRLAAVAMGTSDRWQAGAALLQTADPAGAAALTAVSRLYTANAAALRACAEAAAQTGIAQSCAISVAAPER